VDVLVLLVVDVPAPLPPMVPPVDVPPLLLLEPPLPKLELAPPRSVLSAPTAVLDAGLDEVVPPDAGLLAVELPPCTLLELLVLPPERFAVAPPVPADSLLLPQAKLQVASRAKYPKLC
jgi:hypothetical protein